jgi:hypothetical protein
LHDETVDVVAAEKLGVVAAEEGEAAEEHDGEIVLRW